MVNKPWIPKFLVAVFIHVMIEKNKQDIILLPLLSTHLN